VCWLDEEITMARHLTKTRKSAKQLDRGSSRRLGYALGAFSIGLGAVELFAGRKVSKALGVEQASPLVRTFGLREIATGAAFLARPTASRNAWLRVAGDVLDAGALGGALRSRRAKRGPVLGALAFVGTALAADVAAGVLLKRRASARA
jgi:hypothetical protein